MKKTTIKFYDGDYTISAGDIFQAKVEDGEVGQLFLVSCNDNEQVTLEVIQRINYSSCLMRVNEILYKEDDVLITESYKNRNILLMIEGFTKKQLVSYINENNIDVDTKLKKKDLVRAVKKLL